MIFFILLFTLVNILILWLSIKKNKETNVININNDILLQQEEEINKSIEEKREKLSLLNEALENSKNNADSAYLSYWKLLENEYSKKEKEYDSLINKLEESYNNKQINIINKIEDNKKELDKIKETRIAAQNALLKEKEIKENKSFYCLSISQEDLDDINTLERIKSKLNQPRILCMLIWSTYYQKPMTTLCNNVLGLNIVCGIYKITNQITNECYIGQSVDIAKRWKEHAKCGLGIDTPANNKLYKAMQEYGLNNFSFELIEKCDKSLLNEKEKYYIELYDSYNFGYNNNSGIK